MRELELTSPQINVIHPPSRLGDCTHIPLIFGSLIASNLLQSIGTIFNVRWVSLREVSPGTLCSVQGASAPTASRLLVILFQAVSSKLETSVRLSGEYRASVATWPLTFACLPGHLRSRYMPSFSCSCEGAQRRAASGSYLSRDGPSSSSSSLSVLWRSKRKISVHTLVPPDSGMSHAHCMSRSTPC